MRINDRKSWLIASGALLMLLEAGCLEVDTHILLHPDGSATITERLAFSRDLLELDASSGGSLVKLLDRQAAADRMAAMGKGVTLVKHEIRDGNRGSRESMAVFRIGDIGEFTYVSPFLPEDGINSAVALKASWHAPMRDGSSWEYIAGWLGVQFQPIYPKNYRRPTSQPETPAPVRQQMVRELRTVFADLMKEFHVRIVFESYAPVLRASFGWRDSRTATKKVDLIDFRPGENNDMFGQPFLDNEEIMLDLLQWRLGSPTLAEHLKGWTNNQTLPVLHREGAIYFKPSAELFKRFFEGKTLTHHRTGEVPARFEDIGYRQGDDAKPPPTLPKAASTGPDDPKPTTQPTGRGGRRGNR